jgi:hypothetical protein
MLAERHADEAIATAMEFAECKLQLAEMIDEVWLQVHLIQGSQRARLLGGFIDQPDSDEIDRCARLMAVVRFLENCRDQPEKAIQWLQGRTSRG